MDIFARGLMIFAPTNKMELHVKLQTKKQSMLICFSFTLKLSDVEVFIGESNTFCVFWYSKVTIR